MKSNFEKIGDHIRELNNRNYDLRIDTLLGINIDKYYMPSVANIVGTDLTTYKVVKKGQFACNRMHVGRDYRLPVALSNIDEDFIVSPAYDVFEIINEDFLLPEYLMMWFSRKEFDRNAWFYTDADVRGGLPWKSFCEMKLPVPDIDKQKEIVEEYNTIVNRIELNNKLIQKLEETAQAIYKQWFVDFEFPDKEGKPYKSNGGEMLHNEELQKDIPREWEVGSLDEISSVTSGKAPINKNDNKNEFFVYPIFGAGGIMGYSSNFLFDEEILSIGRVGTHGVVNRINFRCWASDNTLILKSNYYEYVNQILININYDEINRGGVQGLITQTDINKTQILLPNLTVLKLFENKIGKSLKYADMKRKGIEKLFNLKELLLSKLSTIK